MKPHTGRRSLLLALLCAVALPACGAKPATSSDASAAAAGVGRTDAGRSAAITTIAHGLEHPWAVALLDDGSFLVTERPGRLRRVTAQGAISAPIAGMPQVWAQGQAGLLDLELAPDFARSHRIYFSYIEPGDNGTAGTAAATATVDGNSLRDLKVIYREAPKISGTANLGSRIAFDLRLVALTFTCPGWLSVRVSPVE